MTPEADSGVVVIVEDPFLQKFLRSVLTRAGFTTVEANAQTAIELVRSGEPPIRAVITNKPADFRCFARDLPLIYSTSCPDPEAIRTFDHCEVLQKPFHGAQLLQALQNLCSLVIP